MSILEEMYYGNIPHFWEHSITDSEYRKWVNKSVELDKELRKAFPEAEELIDKHERARNEVTEIMSYQQFAYGFRVGAQLMAEMLKPVSEDK